MNALRPIVALAALGALVGCAHPVFIRPEIEALSAPVNGERIPKKVGLYISAANRAKEVTTPGGGGDSVTYTPYADMEAGFYKVLSDVFLDVTVVEGTDAEAMAPRSLSYVVEPEITTMSSSDGFFTWMATDFVIHLKCRVTDATGRPVAIVSSTGTGKAESSELMKNFSLAGQRASQDALLKLRDAFLQTDNLRQ